MHYLVALLFWIAFLIPGFAFTRRWDQALHHGGFLSSIAVSFMGSVCLCVPMVLVGYLFALPISLVSTGIVALVVWGLVDIKRTGGGQALRVQAKDLLRLESLVLGFTLIIQSRVGSYMGGDGLIHLARVRHILDHGLTNIDPFIKGDFFYPLYHTNIYHALLASCTQLTGVDYLEVWYGILPVLVLLVAASTYFLTYQVFASRWVSWLTALFAVATHGHANFITYPNKIAPFIVLPFLFGLAIRALRSRPTGKDALQIGALSLTLSMIHGMYAVFGVIILLPLFLFQAARLQLRKKSYARNLVMCGAALLLALPMPLISRAGRNEAKAETTRLRMARDLDKDALPIAISEIQRNALPNAAGLRADPFFHELKSGMLMKKPLRGFGGGEGIFGIRGFRYQFLVLGCVLALLARTKRRYLIAGSITLVTASYLFVPPLCTALFQIFGAKWMLQRLDTAGLAVMFPTLVFGSLAFFLQSKVRLFQIRGTSNRLRCLTLQGIVSIFVLCFAFSSSGQWARWRSFTLDDPWTPNKRSWGMSYKVAFRYDIEARQEKLRTMQKRRELYRKVVPVGANVIVIDNLALELVALHDAHILDAIRSSDGVPDRDYYRHLNKIILDPTTDWQTRKRVLNEAGARFYIPQDGQSRWLRGHIKNHWPLHKSKTELVEILID
ncbi:MAG: hypothetical protein ACI97A_002073 [Planctomycetota bacterium]|jgi:hypothetical protein